MNAFPNTLHFPGGEVTVDPQHVTRSRDAWLTKTGGSCVVWLCGGRFQALLTAEQGVEFRGSSRLSSDDALAQALTLADYAEAERVA